MSRALDQWPPAEPDDVEAMEEMFERTRQTLLVTQSPKFHPALTTATSDQLIFELVDTKDSKRPFGLVHGIQIIHPNTNHESGLLIRPTDTSITLINTLLKHDAEQIARVLCYEYADDKLFEKEETEGDFFDWGSDETYEEDYEHDDDDINEPDDDQFTVEYDWETEQSEEQIDMAYAVEQGLFLDFFEEQRALRKLYFAIVNQQLSLNHLYHYK